MLISYCCLPSIEYNDLLGQRCGELREQSVSRKTCKSSLETHPLSSTYSGMRLRKALNVSNASPMIDHRNCAVSGQPGQ